MKITFGASGSAASAAGSSRSAVSVLTPWRSRRSRSVGSEKRETAMTRRAGLRARRAMRARVGPIFPPAPRIRRSPGNRRRTSVTPRWDGIVALPGLPQSAGRDRSHAGPVQPFTARFSFFTLRAHSPASPSARTPARRGRCRSAGAGRSSAPCPAASLPIARPTLAAGPSRRAP